jgi:HAD superfamily hydrolase (TIGR01509 family)
MNPELKAIIFDFDGVVVNSEPLYEETGRELFRQFGIEIQDRDWREFKGLSAKGFFDLAVKKYKIKISKEELFKLDHEILKDKFRDKLEYIPGFHSFLNYVKKNFCYALVTSTSAELLNWIFANTPIARDFTHIITADDINHPKPHPEPFLTIAKKLQICPSEMLVIEDSINGVISAKEAGSCVVGFLTSFEKEELSQADYHANNFSEIQRLLTEHDRFK